MVFGEKINVDKQIYNTGLRNAMKKPAYFHRQFEATLLFMGEWCMRTHKHNDTLTYLY